MHLADDHYATLGVPPRSEASAIRAAYLDLMRRFHPDKNATPEATERAHAIIAAFAVLGNVEKRLHYDWARRRAADEAAASQRRWGTMTPKVLIAPALILALLVPLLFVAFTGAERETRAMRPKPKMASTAAVPLPTKAVIAVPIAEDLPTASSVQIAAVEPRPLEPPVPAQPALKVDEPAAVAASPPQLAQRREPRQARNAVRPQPPAAASDNPRCRSASPGAEAAICNNDNLAALDRSVVTFYNQSLQFGAPAKRGPLLDARIAFLLRREECRSDACLQSLHLAHLREMSAIVEQAPP